jgi:CMP-N-acetylneuraminic acid synthetase
MRVLGVIPARGGSKGVPGKNIRPLHGLPLICYSICTAASSALARTIVTTDSPDIARAAIACGGDIPFMRPTELAADDTPTLPVILHALDVLQENFDAVMILQPTSPLRTSEDIDAAISLLAGDPSADAVISVVKVSDHHPARMKILRDGVLYDPPFMEEVEGLRRQDLPEYYLRNGAVYLTRTAVLWEQQSFKGRKCLGYLMPEDRSVNIDSELDFMLVNAILGMRQGR